MHGSNDTPKSHSSPVAASACQAFCMSTYQQLALAHKAIELGPKASLPVGRATERVIFTPELDVAILSPHPMSTAQQLRSTPALLRS
jgi:hypothetical protein